MAHHHPDCPHLDDAANTVDATPRAASADGGRCGRAARDWYAFEAIERLVDFGFTQLDLHSVEAGVTPGNTDSGRLLERLGFRLEGHLRENYWAEGRFVDSLVYGLLRSEWTARRGDESPR